MLPASIFLLLTLSPRKSSNTRVFLLLFLGEPKVEQMRVIILQTEALAHPSGVKEGFTNHGKKLKLYFKMQ
jgi:hypothetical protein